MAERLLGFRCSENRRVESMSGPSAEYFYTPTADARKCIGFKVNLFGIITDFSVSVKSRGSDYFISLKVSDESSPGFFVNFFAEVPFKLPHIKEMGDIIIVHRVVMRVYNEKVYGCYDKRFSSFALFEGRSGEGFNAYQTSANYHPMDNQNDRLSHLRKRLLAHKFDTVMKSYPLRLKSIKTETVFDLVCKVLHVCETSVGQWMIYVWDGTDTPPVTFRKDLNTEGENPSPLHLDTVPLSREVLKTFPCIGTVLRIVVKKYFEEIPQMLEGCCWVKLCNLTCELPYGIWRGLLHVSSEVHFLSDEDEYVKRNIRDFEGRISCEARCHPLTYSPRVFCITGITDTELPFATLISSLTHAKVEHRFRSIVRVVSAHPWKADQLRSIVDGHYRIKLTLEDPTARIRAVIIGADAEVFFGGYLETDVLLTKMRMILGIKDYVGETRAAYCVRDPPWLSVVLASYCLDKDNPLESRRYKIFATTLLD